ncbi:PspC domain-containing protein [uncultured Psychroserpens sp.]|uniref:PspC domain-containing protein n=1 Tax=uncultured Psychroserpens sp. TaxID=255436 RepID=UPI00261D99BA|nr:PspC domain-containing protein [uncultured Psychroserpens sp.]
MNKTVNINLAGIFFHIDEDAYLKLQRYLEAIKRSFTDSQGRSEIISDIEARIAELFSERVQNERQVIGQKEVDEVITIMGQPEDYLVDDEIFEDEPQRSYTRKSSNAKKLFRDTDNSYVGGVSAGLAHYFGVDVIWIRLIWILLIFGAGTGVLLYILLWIFVPEATTTSEKLMMKGEPVNISNIEKKIKDGFDSVSTAVQNVDLKKQGDKIKEGFEHVTESISEGVKKADLPKQGERIKSTSTSFFETIGNIIMFFLKMFAKFFGLILMFVGAVTIISLIVSLLSLSLLETVNIPGTNFYDIAEATNLPLWVMSLLVFFFVGIIAFFVFYLGLKILITNLKSIGNAAKYTLLGLWFISFISLIVLSARFGLSFKEEGSYIKTEKLAAITSNDTITMRMNNNDLFTSRYWRSYGFDTAYDENDNKVLYSRGVRLIVKSTKDSIAKIRVERSSRGFDFEDAKTRAERIEYNYQLKNKELLLDSYFTLPINESRKGQEVIVTVYLPEGSVLYADSNTYNYHSNQNYYNDILDHDMEEHYLKIITNGVECLDCPEDEEFKVKVDIEDDENSGLKIDEDGIKAKTENSSLQIDSDGIKAKSDDVKVNIDDDGIEITTDNDNN